ncbi:MAG: hypothetical protein A2Z21_05980 [Candidatus Fraserbacteria bacterium RBG_16_55_9]|uniref:Solute-binding protein family 5 domain-containing protein n=1 Tax=Fraserbacteria sp. (strain RBG_16_55_9) TaxID=1817864 RepID=A0A1F5V1V0_FRAXR|nr:MAG: hypothetical protein A2Z21_05980 [Candidatus Fraserbacteria bacterium RBG_16_55_9]
MKRVLQLPAVSLLLVGVLLASGFVSSPASRAQNLPSSAKIVGAPLIETPGRPGGELRDASASVPRSLNPYVEFSDLALLLQAHLVEVNPLTLAVEPALAESFATSEDNTKLTITLREGLRWSDGELLTMDDILFTFVDVLQDEELLRSLQEFGVDISPPPFQVVPVDERTFRFDFSAPVADQALGDLTGIATVLPKHKLAGTVTKLNPNAAPDAFARAWGLLSTTADQIAGLGPFRVKEIQKTGIPFISERATAIVLERNPYYWKVDSAGTQLPYVDRFTRSFVATSADAVARLKSGQIDLLGGVTVANAVGLADQPGLQLVVYGPVPTITLLSFNQDSADPDLKTLFRDARFRQAVAYTLDRPTLLQGVPERAPFFAPRESFVHPISPFFNEAATAKFEFDLGKAKALLDAIGLRDTNGDGVREFSSGKRVAFELITNDNNPVRVEAGKLMQVNLQQIGIEADYRPIPFDEVVQRLDIEGQEPDYQAVIIGFGVGGSLITPGYLQDLFGSQGDVHIQRFSDAQGEDLPATQRRIDEILANPGSTPEERTGRLNELQQILSEDLSLIPLWSERAITAIRPQVKNAQVINHFGLASFLEVLWKE